MAAALESARSLSTVHGDKGPLLEFFDWTNPDPQAEAYDGAVALSDALALIPELIVWKVTGVSSLEIALHEVRNRLRSKLSSLHRQSHITGQVCCYRIFKQ